MNVQLLIPCLIGAALSGAAPADEPVGKRPYEMAWANRTEDAHPALLDFESLDGWKTEYIDSVAELTRSRRQQLWGRHVGRLVYRGTSSKASVTLKPPKPIPVPSPFDCINFWVYGNNWAWVPDRSTPQVEIAVLLRGTKGQSVRIPMGHVNWQEWWVMHRKLNTEQRAQLAEGAALEGLQIVGGRNTENRELYFDNLSCYQEQLAPLKFEPRPERGIAMFPGQSVGTNTGPGKLPFPTREETILPDNLTTDFKVALESSGDTFAWHYRGSDGHLVYRYKPATGTLGDITAEWVGWGGPFQPMAGGGVRPTGLGIRETANGVELGGAVPKPIGCRRDGDTVAARWRISRGPATSELTYRFRLWQKSLVIDVIEHGGHVKEVGFGKAVGLPNPRLVTLPYLTGDWQHRPAVLVAGQPEKPLFLMGLVDHCRSNATSLWFANEVASDGAATYNGGSRYEPKTDGKRNDCFERLFLTVSPRFEEVLPNVPNAKSPWMHVAGERLWIAHGASDRKRDYELFKNVARYGMTKVVITDHETGWRDGGESFTFRTRAAPGRGGDESQTEYSRRLRALGFRYGIYNNYTDFAPVNEHWHEDMVTRLSDGNWQTAWARCYNPKPARAVEYEARLAPIIQQKFRLDTAYCDVHTAVTPWQYCDRDARVPGAGTFAATFYSYGEIMLHQKKTWNGPVYSEGNNHWYYCGLTDGNYGQDQAAHLPESPWLVDFDLRKLHPLCCNFGMGNPGMFYGERRGLGKTPEEREASLDRFLAATLAFGHTGFLVMDGGMPSAARSYFSLQAAHAAYAQEKVVDIRYADEEGRLLDVSAAIATGAYRRNQVLTTYSNGLTVVVNGHPTKAWKWVGMNVGLLQPSEWLVEDEQGRIVAWSMQWDGHRADLVDCSEYTYADGRGHITRFGLDGVCDGQMIVLKRSDRTAEVIPVGECKVLGWGGLRAKKATAVALDAEGRPIGPAETRYSREVIHILPVAKAFSYVLTPQDGTDVGLECERDNVIPGEKVIVHGKREHTFQIPRDAKVGSLLWHQAEGAWIDFTVVPLVEARLDVGDSLRLTLGAKNLSGTVDGHVAFVGDIRKVVLTEREESVSTSPLQLVKEEVRALPLVVTAGDMRYERKWWLKAEEAIAPVRAAFGQFRGGECFRKGKERSFDGKSGAHAHWTEYAFGGVSRRCLFMHPPYMGGVGYTFALLEPVDLPKQWPAAFRCLIGKGDGSDPGDGILFRIAVVDAKDKETIVAEKQWIKHAWTPLEADLSRWAGQRVRIKLIADVGPADDSSGDWAAWAELKLESLKPVLTVSVHDAPVTLARQAGPHPVQNLTAADLREARRAVLHFQGKGLGHASPYISAASLSDVRLGELPEAGGDEVRGVWADARLEMPAKAIAALSEWNRLAIDNPGNDSFAIRRVWIELELADGRKASSDITTTSYTQPPEWPYGEGERVPFGKPIEMTVRFRVK
jgi:hypothetical protein